MPVHPRRGDDAWGIKVNRVEVKNITPAAAIQQAMEKQMKAEREKREAVLLAEGQKQSAITVAEGEEAGADPLRRSREAGDYPCCGS